MMATGALLLLLSVTVWLFAGKRLQILGNRELDQVRSDRHDEWRSRLGDLGRHQSRFLGKQSRERYVRRETL